MIRILATLSLFLVSTAAFASGSSVFRYASESMTCRQARDVIAAKGAVLLIWGNGHLYDRFVHHGGFCLNGESTRPAQVPTRDTDDCFALVCETRSGDGGGDSGSGQ